MPTAPLVGTPETSGSPRWRARRVVIHTSDMRLSTSFRSAAPGAVLGLAAIASAAPAEIASIVPETASPAVAEACERSARQAVPNLGRELVEVTFTSAPTVQPGPAIDGQIVLRGAGRWRAPTGVRTFTYSCNVEAKSGEAVGVVMRDTTPQPAAKAPPPRPPAEPDLSALSPAACESSAVAALKARWPRVSQITFDPRTREFRQPSPSSASLHGSGQALPSTDSPTRLFGFDCEIDPRDGRVLRISISG
jgi:hypothetical protein